MPKDLCCGLCGKPVGSHFSEHGGLVLCNNHWNYYRVGEQPVVFQCPYCGHRFDPDHSPCFAQHHKCPSCDSELHYIPICLFVLENEQHFDLRARKYAVELLGRLFEWPREAPENRQAKRIVEVLIALLQDEGLRTTAAFALAKTGDPEALEPLKKARPKKPFLGAIRFMLGLLPAENWGDPRDFDVAITRLEQKLSRREENTTG